MPVFGLPFRSNTTPNVGSFAFGSTAVASLTDVPVPPIGGYPISIAGRNYMVDTSFEPYRREAFRHKSISPQRQSMHFTNIPDDGTVSTEGLWRREARDWGLGAGQIYFDRKGSDDSRFYKSKGIDPWQQWQATLLSDTKKQYTSTTLGNTIKAIRAGAYAYIIDGNVLKFTGDWSTFTTVTGISGNILDIASDSFYVWVLTTGGLFQGVVGNSDGVATLFKWTLLPLSTGSVTGLISWSGGRLIVALSNVQTSGTNATPAVPAGSPVFDMSYNTNIATVQGYLTAAVNSSVTTIPVDSLQHALANNVYVQIESEIVRLTAAAALGATSISVTRGALSTTAVAHAQGTPILTEGTSGSTTNAFTNVSNISTVTTASMGWLYTHPNPTWIWAGMAAGSSQIYLAGHVTATDTTNYGTVYRTTISSSGTTPARLTSPVECLPLPHGEYPTAIRGYLNYVFLGTNKGIRMCQTLNGLDPSGSSGDLKSGPLIPNITQPLTQPVTGIVGNDRYIYWTWNNYDGTSTGLGRLDLTSFIGEIAPAYTSDLMVTGQGTVSHISWDPITDSPLMSVTLTGVKQAVWTADPSNVVASGSIDSGLITYGIPDYKNAVSLDVGVKNITGTVDSSAAFNMDIDDTSSLSIGSYSGGNRKNSFGFSQQFGEQYRVTTTLNAATTQSGVRVSPTLNRWTLKALPGIPSGILISAVLLMYEPMEVEGQTIYVDPYTEYAYLEQLRQSQQVVTYVEGPFEALVTVDLIDWMPERRRAASIGGYHGNLVVTLKTVTG